jgi:hypothetical protein
VWFLEKLAHFDCEVIPERRMHGTAAARQLLRSGAPVRDPDRWYGRLLTTRWARRRMIAICAQESKRQESRRGRAYAIQSIPPISDSE